VVLDTGGVSGLAPIDEKRRARLRVLRARATDFVVPAAVLAEGALSGRQGHDFHIRRLLELVDVADVDEALGYAAGHLRQGAVHGGVDPAPSAVDAIVVAVADVHAGYDDVEIITSDGADIELLASLAEQAARVAVTVV
jgi:predicted nucleic acid-binding protein